MNAAELIAQLSQHNPDTPVRLVVTDECDSSAPVDICSVQRCITNQPPMYTYIEIEGEL